MTFSVAVIRFYTLVQIFGGVLLMITVATMADIAAKVQVTGLSTVHSSLSG